MKYLYRIVNNGIEQKTNRSQWYDRIKKAGYLALDYTGQQVAKSSYLDVFEAYNKQGLLIASKEKIY